MHHQLRGHPAGGDAGKSADPERAAQARDASFPLENRLALLVPAEQDAAAEPYIPDAARSAEQSCAAQAFAARQPLAERLDAEYSASREQRAARKRSSMALQAQGE